MSGDKEAGGIFASLRLLQGGDGQADMKLSPSWPHQGAGEDGPSWGPLLVLISSPPIYAHPLLQSGHFLLNLTLKEE